MLAWIFSNIQNLTTALSVLAIAGVGVFAFIGWFGKQKDGRQQESDALADTLINRLKEQVAQMQTDIDAHTVTRDAEIKELRTRVDHLTGRNSMLEDLFKGRDPLMQDFYKKAPDLIEGVRKNGEDMRKLEQTLTKFVDALQPVLVHIESRLPKKTKKKGVK